MTWLRQLLAEAEQDIFVAVSLFVLVVGCGVLAVSLVVQTLQLVRNRGGNR